MIRAKILKRYPAAAGSAGFELSIEVEAGPGVTVLFGPSGAGKTLTLHSIAGFVRPDEGRIVVDDNALFDAAGGVNLPPRDRRCGYVFQNYALFPHMSLRENLEFAAHRLPAVVRESRVSEQLDRFRLTNVAARRPHQVSGGQQQRCSIARALIGEPRILLLDEPARGLDAPLRADLYTVLRQVRQEFDTPILLVTHDLEECFELGDTMLVLLDGRVVQSGAPDAVLSRPAGLEVARLLGRFRFVEANVLEAGADSTKLSIAAGELRGPPCPGAREGDAATLAFRPELLRASPGPDGLPAELERTVRTPRFVRLEFRGGLVVEQSYAEFNARRDNGTNSRHIQFPPESCHLFRGASEKPKKL